MSDRQFKSLRALFVGLTASLFSLGAVLLVGPAVPEAQAEDQSSWTWLVTDRLSDVADAEDWKGARVAARALNSVAKHVPRGTVATFPVGDGSGPALVCVK